MDDIKRSPLSAAVNGSDHRQSGKSARHITLLRPPVISSKYSFSAPVTAPLALAYLSASLIKEGFDVTPLDALGEAIGQVLIYDDPPCRVRGLADEKILERIPTHTQLIAVSCMFTQEWLYIKRIIQKIKKQFPDVPIVVGGEHANAVPENILATCPEVDLCAQGEGEETIVDIARYYPEQPEKIPGIVYRTPQGQVRRNPTRARIRHLEDIPRPAWHLLPLEPYLAGGHGQGINAGRAIPILATRGCPFQCTFCSNKGMWTQRYYTRSPEDVVDEIEDYVRRYRIDAVEFFDLTAIVRKEWIMKFGGLLKERGLNITWSLPSGTRSEALDEEVTRLLGETNCRYLVYAAESGSPRILKYIKKEVQLDRMIRSMRAAKKNGLNLRCNLMLGFPKEKRSDVWRTILFQIRLAFIGVDDAPMYMFSPYPGTELFDYLRGTGKIPDLDEHYYRGLLCQMDLTQTSTYCENMGAKELGAYRLIGMCLFYTLSYLSRPWRIIRSARNIFFRHTTDTVFEQRIAELLAVRRHAQNKRGQSLKTASAL